MTNRFRFNLENANKLNCRAYDWSTDAAAVVIVVVFFASVVDKAIWNISEKYNVLSQIWTHYFRNSFLLKQLLHEDRYIYTQTHIRYSLFTCGIFIDIVRHMFLLSENGILNVARRRRI